MSKDQAASDKVRLEIDGDVAVIVNDRPEKRNAFTDEMDARLFQILREIGDTPAIRAVVWRGSGPSFSSGRDLSAIGGSQSGLTHHDLMRRGHRGIQKLFDLDPPVIVAMQGWAIGASFQRALLCDIRIAAEGARFALPEVTHGVIPDTGGVARLFQMCGHGVASDMVLTGRPMSADEALCYGVVSRVVPEDELLDTAMDMAHMVAATPAVTVKMARRVIKHLSEPDVRSSMAEELIAQTFVAKSDDLAEMRAAANEGRDPRFTGS